MANSCKFYKEKKQVSTNSGATWDDVIPYEYRRGNLIERDSDDCRQGALISRFVTIPDAFMCEGKNKYQKKVGQYSLDNGSTWEYFYPSIYQKGNLLEANSEICHNKWEGHYYSTGSNSCEPGHTYVIGFGCAPITFDPVKYVRCESTTSTTLTRDEVSYRPYALYEGYIGDCVTSIGERAFYGCTSLSSITIPENVTSIETYAFEYCTSLSSVTIPSGITSIKNYVFFACYSLTSVTIPDSVTAIGRASFYSCDSLTSVTIPDSVTAIGREAFCYCDNLNSVIIGSGVTEINADAFYSCSGLSSVTCLATTPPWLYNGVFNGASPNLVIYVPCESVSAYKNSSRWEDYADRITGIPPCETPPPPPYKWLATYSGGTTSSAECDSSSAITQTAITRTNLVSVEIMDCVTTIGYHALDYAHSLSSITIPNTVTSIGEYAFYECNGLTSIDIPSGVTSIGEQAFNKCSGLTSIDIPSGVTSISTATFASCSGLTSITIPSGVTSIGQSAFNYCGGLESITCLATVPPTLRDYAFDNTNNCPIYVDDNLVDTYKTAWSTYASRIRGINQQEFYRWYPSGTTCVGYDKYENSIRQISYDNVNWENVIPEEYSATTLIEAYSEDCGAPQWYKWVVKTGSTIVSSAVCDSSSAISRYEVSLSNSQSKVIVGDCVTTIGDSAFRRLDNLGSAILSDNVTTIGDYGFRLSSNIQSVDIGSGITSIGSYAFEKCYALATIICRATTPPTLGYGALNNLASGYVVYVPAASVNAYKAASGWSTYSSHIQPIT